jgi:hypothetical protein
MSQRCVRGRGAYGHIIVPRAWAKGYYDLLQEGYSMRCYSAQRLQHGRSV